MASDVIDQQNLEALTHTGARVEVLDISGCSKRTGLPLTGGDAGVSEVRWRVAVGWEVGQDMSAHSTAEEREAERLAAQLDGIGTGETDGTISKPDIGPLASGRVVSSPKAPMHSVARPTPTPSSTGSSFKLTPQACDHMCRKLRAYSDRLIRLKFSACWSRGAAGGPASDPAHDMDDEDERRSSAPRGHRASNAARGAGDKESGLLPAKRAIACPRFAASLRCLEAGDSVLLRAWHVRSFQSLKYLSLSQLGPSGAVALSGLPRLEALRLHDTQLCSVRGAALRRILRKLRALGLVRCDLRPRRALLQPAWAVMCDVMGSCSQLQSLVIDDKQDPLEAARARNQSARRAWRARRAARRDGLLLQAQGIGGARARAQQRQESFSLDTDDRAARDRAAALAHGWLPPRVRARDVWSTESIRHWAGAFLRCRASLCHEQRRGGAPCNDPAPRHLDLSRLSEGSLGTDGLATLLQLQVQTTPSHGGDIAGVESRHSASVAQSSAQIQTTCGLHHSDTCVCSVGAGLQTLALPRSCCRADQVSLSVALAACKQLVGLSVPWLSTGPLMDEGSNRSMRRHARKSPSLSSAGWRSCGSEWAGELLESCPRLRVLAAPFGSIAVLRGVVDVLLGGSAGQLRAVDLRGVTSAAMSGGSHEAGQSLEQSLRSVGIIGRFRPPEDMPTGVQTSASDVMGTHAGVCSPAVKESGTSTGLPDRASGVKPPEASTGTACRHGCGAWLSLKIDGELGGKHADQTSQGAIFAELQGDHDQVCLLAPRQCPAPECGWAGSRAAWNRHAIGCTHWVCAMPTRSWTGAMSSVSSDSSDPLSGGSASSMCGPRLHAAEWATRKALCEQSAPGNQARRIELPSSVSDARTKEAEHAALAASVGACTWRWATQAAAWETDLLLETRDRGTRMRRDDDLHDHSSSLSMADTALGGPAWRSIPGMIFAKDERKVRLNSRVVPEASQAPVSGAGADAVLGDVVGACYSTYKLLPGDGLLVAPLGTISAALQDQSSDTVPWHTRLFRGKEALGTQAAGVHPVIEPVGHDLRLQRTVVLTELRVSLALLRVQLQAGSVFRARGRLRTSGGRRGIVNAVGLVESCIVHPGACSLEPRSHRQIEVETRPADPSGSFHRLHLSHRHHRSQVQPAVARVTAAAIAKQQDRARALGGVGWRNPSFASKRHRRELARQSATAPTAPSAPNLSAGGKHSSGRLFDSQARAEMAATGGAGSTIPRRVSGFMPRHKRDAGGDGRQRGSGVFAGTVGGPAVGIGPRRAVQAWPDKRMERRLRAGVKHNMSVPLGWRSAAARERGRSDSGSHKHSASRSRDQRRRAGLMAQFGDEGGIDNDQIYQRKGERPSSTSGNLAPRRRSSARHFSARTSYARAYAAPDIFRSRSGPAVSRCASNGAGSAQGREAAAETNDCDDGNEAAAAATDGGCVHLEAEGRKEGEGSC